VGQYQSFGDVGSMSGLPESGHGRRLKPYSAAGYNFRRLLAWLRFLLLRILIALGLAAQLKLA
jgi:hypothetical protein